MESSRGKRGWIADGDITRGQCKRAVGIANEFLDNKIEMPSRCYTDRLIKRRK
jgi:hypothetical protein